MDGHAVPSAMLLLAMAHKFGDERVMGRWIVRAVVVEPFMQAGCMIEESRALGAWSLEE